MKRKLSKHGPSKNLLVELQWRPILGTNPGDQSLRCDTDEMNEGHDAFVGHPLCADTVQGLRRFPLTYEIVHSDTQGTSISDPNTYALLRSSKVS